MLRTRAITFLSGLALALALAGCGSDPEELGSDEGAPTSSAGEELIVLADDKKLQTVDNVVPIVNTRSLTPPLRAALDRVSEKLTTDDLIALNRKVDVDRETPVNVAKEYAEQAGLTTGLSGGSGKIVVTAAGFSENQILGNLYAQVLDAAGFDADVKPVTNREVYLPALQRGEVQVAAEYVGTLTEFLNKKKNGPDAAPVASGDLAKTLAALTPLAAGVGLTPLTPSQAADQNAFAVTRTFADEHGLKTLSDLADHEGDLVLGGPAECPTRTFCQPGLEKTYGIEFSSFVSLDAGGPLTKTALKQGRIQVGLVFSSDGSLTPAGSSGSR